MDRGILHGGIMNVGRIELDRVACAKSGTAGCFCRCHDGGEVEPIGCDHVCCRPIETRYHADLLANRAGEAEALRRQMERYRRALQDILATEAEHHCVVYGTAHSGTAPCLRIAKEALR